MRKSIFNWFDSEDQYLPSFRQFHPISELHSQIDRIFNEAFGSNESKILLRPKLDIASTDKEYILNLEVPGVEEKDISIELSNDHVLAIKGIKKQEKEEKNKNFHRIERSYGSFERILHLPEDVEKDQVHASFKNGVLTITCNRKALPNNTTKKIDITKN